MLRSHIIIRNGCFEIAAIQTNLEGNTQGKLQNIFRQAPEFQLARVQHITRLLNESVPDFDIDRHLLEAKFRVGKVVTTPCHEGMDMAYIPIIPVYIEIRISARRRGKW